MCAALRGIVDRLAAYPQPSCRRMRGCGVGICRNLLSALVALTSMAHAQVSFDPVRVDPQHFKVEYEDTKVRVLRFRLLAGEKSPMQEHPGRTVVSLTNS